MCFSIRWKLILFIVGPVILIAFFGLKVTIDVIQSNTTIRLHEQATETARNYASKLDAEFRAIAQVAQNTAAFLEIVPDLNEVELFALLRANVEQNPLIYGSAIAYSPFKFNSDIELFSPYVYRKGDELLKMDIAKDGYDYTDEPWEWFVRSRDTEKPLWTEPYYDEGAGNILMDTYAVPFFRDGKFRGVATVDIPLDRLQQRSGLEDLTDQPFVIVSPSGRFISHPDTESIMVESIQQRAEETGEPGLRMLANDMLSGRSGVVRVERLDFLNDEPYWVFYSPIKSTGWSFATALSEAQILAYSRAQINRGIIGLSLMIILIIICVLLVGSSIIRPIQVLAEAVGRLGGGNLDVSIGQIRSKDEVGQLSRAFNDMVRQLRQHVNALTKETAARESVESELRVAQDIQSSLLPGTFPPYPDRPEFDLHAINVAAKHVGGDFFDFFLVDDKTLMLVIADVSGKGVPAAILMAVTRTIVRNQAENNLSPAQILSETNRLMNQDRKQPMFVTLFMASYDIQSGKICYANGGHLPPLRIDANGHVSQFGEATGTIVGMLDDAVYDECEDELKPGEAIILYTDGILEARLPDGKFFGDANFRNLLSANMNEPVKDLCEFVITEITGYQANKLSDDVTIMGLRRNYSDMP